MQTIARRDFLAAGAALLAAARLEADPLGLPIGCQVYPVRQALGQDLPGTLRQIASMGYKTIEMCSPSGYERGGFAPLAKMKTSELRQAIHDAGLGCESSHFTFPELKEKLDDRIAFAKELGLKQMVLSTFGRPKSMAEWVSDAEALNQMAAQIHKAGLRVGFHNHNFEFEKIDGELVYDKLMSTLDPKLVQMQFQVSVISLGYEAATYFTKYPGRFLSIHLQDWSPAEKKSVAIGRGVVDWKKLFGAAKKAGVRNYFVELPVEEMKPSYDYLHGLKV